MDRIEKILNELEKNDIKVPKQINTKDGIVQYLKARKIVYMTKLHKLREEYEATRRKIDLLTTYINLLGGTKE